MKRSYKPEGFIYNGTSITRNSANHSLSFIGDGKIYEGMTVKCDSSLNLWVDFGGIKCMMPRDEVSYLFPGERLKDIAIISRVGKPVCFKITGKSKTDDGKDILIISRKSAQEECLHEYIDNLIPGDVIDAKVTHMEQFGAFCDIGCGIISLMTVDSISISRISHPKDRFEVGENIRAVVKNRSEDGRIYITHKELLGTWEENAKQFAQGQTVAGIVRSIESYGIFIELSPNLAGLSELRDDVSTSDTVAVYIKSMIPERMKIKLVIVDTKGTRAAKMPLTYIGDLFRCDHISRWRYSPEFSSRVIESVF